MTAMAAMPAIIATQAAAMAAGLGYPLAAVSRQHTADLYPTHHVQGIDLDSQMCFTSNL